MENINITQLRERINSTVNLFLCATSFEDRCLTIGTNLPIDKVDSVAVLNYENNYSKALSNLERIKEHFKNKDVLLSECIIFNDKPIANCDVFIKILSDLPINSNILIDISTITRENLLILIKLAKERFANLDFHIAYTPSKVYADMWLSRGVDEIRSVLGYAGEFSPLKKILLIVLVGFEYERAQILIESYEPNLLYLGKASKEESINEELAQVNDRNFNTLSECNPDAKIFEFSCKDMDITKQAIATIVNNHKEEYNIVISPMNNKLSTLAVASEVLKNPNVQICYATTNQYNTESYSQECDYIYLMNISEI